LYIGLFLQVQAYQKCRQENVEFSLTRSKTIGLSSECFHSYIQDVTS